MWTWAEIIPKGRRATWTSLEITQKGHFSRKKEILLLNARHRWRKRTRFSVPKAPWKALLYFRRYFLILFRKEFLLFFNRIHAIFFKIVQENNMFLSLLKHTISLSSATLRDMKLIKTLNMERNWITEYFLVHPRITSDDKINKYFWWVCYERMCLLNNCV